MNYIENEDQGYNIENEELEDEETQEDLELRLSEQITILLSNENNNLLEILTLLEENGYYFTDDDRPKETDNVKSFFTSLYDDESDNYYFNLDKFCNLCTNPSLISSNEDFKEILNNNFLSDNEEVLIDGIRCALEHFHWELIIMIIEKILKKRRDIQLDEFKCAYFFE